MGLISSTFLTPAYDITFSKQAAPHSRRGRERYHDFRLMPDDGETIVFLGGRGYQLLFQELTSSLRAHKIILFSGATVPQLSQGFICLHYPTRTRTNWHYEAARSLAAGELDPVS